MDLDILQSAALWERGNAVVGLASGGAEVTFRTGRAARLVQRFRTSENRQLAQGFLDSLGERYGAHVAGEVLRASDLDVVLAQGTPLRARHVRQAVLQAGGFLAGVRTLNAGLARSCVAPGVGNPGNAEWRGRIELEARRNFPDNPSVASLLDTEATARKIRAAIVEAGGGGTRLLSSNAAADILARVINDELAAALRAAGEEAMRKLSLGAAQSIGDQALAAAGESASPLNLEASRLTPDARSELNRRLRASIGDGSIPADRLDNEASLRSLADKVVGEFVRERVEAANAMARIPFLGDMAQQALACHLLHDNVPAGLVPELAFAFVVNHDDAAALGTSLRASELEQKVVDVQRAMTEAFSASGMEIDDDNRDTLFRTFWRCLLVPGGTEQARALASRAGAPASPLRAIGEAAKWYRKEFPGTAHAGQANPDAPEGTDETADESRAWWEGPSRIALRTAAMIDALIAVANERLDASERVAPLEARERVPDETVATLRNLGIPMPAPDRVGDANPNVPLSAPGVWAIRRELAEHMQSMGGRALQDGVLQESIKDYDRNTYRLNGRQLPLDKRAVVRELRTLCTDGEGRLNERLLKSLSMVAYQATPGCVVATCLNPLRPNLAIFDGSPTLEPVSRSYNISTDERGNVLVNCEMSGPVIRYDRFDRNGGPVVVETDSSASHIRLDMTVGIDANTAEPELRDIELGYSLVPYVRIPPLTPSPGVAAHDRNK